MKIVAIEFAGRGGMIHYMYQLCRGMSEAGADVTLITDKNYELAALPHTFEVDASLELWDPKPPGELSTSFVARTFRKVRRVFRALRYYAEWLRLIRYVGSLEPDVIQLGDIRFPFDLFPLMLLRRKAKTFADICHNVHPFSAGGKSGGLFDRSLWRRFFYRRIYKLFDVVFVHFERNRAEFKETFGLPDRRIGVIVHGNERIFEELADANVTADTLRKRYAMPAGERVVLFFGTLSRYKGTDVLIQAFPQIRAATGARLVLAGYPFHDFDLNAHKQLVASLGLSDAVTWVPEYIASEEIKAWMGLASVIVFPYRDIYQSGALHVAQTFGVPTVASRVGAMQDVIVDEQSGLLVPMEDRDALAAAVVRLLSDSALAQRVSRRMLEDADGPFSWRTIAAIITSKYAEVTR